MRVHDADAGLTHGWIDYRWADTWLWIHDRGRVTIVDDAGGAVLELTGWEAVVWGWLSLGLAYPRLTGLTADLLGIDVARADTRLRDLADRWQGIGLLTREEIAGG